MTEPGVTLDDDINPEVYEEMSKKSLQPRGNEVDVAKIEREEGGN